MDETSRPWYKFQNLGTGVTDAYIYDEIGISGITASDFITDLAKVSGPVNLHLNTPGGDVFDGIAIYNALKERDDVDIYVDSLAASIGSVIAMGGKRIIMAKHSSMMIHDAFGIAVGNAQDMKKMADRLEETSNEIAAIYQERAGGMTKTWRNKMKAETWYKPEDAIAAGLATEVGGRVKSQSLNLVTGKVWNSIADPRGAWRSWLNKKADEGDDDEEDKGNGSDGEKGKKDDDEEDAGKKFPFVKSKTGFAVHDSEVSHAHDHGDLVHAHAHAHEGEIVDHEHDHAPTDLSTLTLIARAPSTALGDRVIQFSDHGTAQGEWAGPLLQDFTDKMWDQLSSAEKARIAAHFTSRDGDSFADLHFPHHLSGKSGVGPAVKAGVDAAGAKLKGTLTDAFEVAVKAHLDKHQAQFGKSDVKDESVDKITNKVDEDVVDEHTDDEVTMAAIFAEAFSDKEEGDK